MLKTDSKLPTSRKTHHIVRVVLLLRSLQLREVVTKDPLKRGTLHRIIPVQRRVGNVLTAAVGNPGKLFSTLGRSALHLLVCGWEEPCIVDVEREEAAGADRGVCGCRDRAVGEETRQERLDVVGYESGGRKAQTRAPKLLVYS